MEIQMRLCNCAACGISFAMPEAHAKRLEECHNTFYCPAGHTNYYPQKSDVEILRDRVAARDKIIAGFEAAEQKRAADSRKRAALARKNKSKSKKVAPAKSR